MPQIFSLSQRTTNFTSSQSSVEYRTAAATRGTFLEIGYTLNTATASSLGIGRPAAQGVTPVNVLFLGEDPNDTAVTNGSLSWATSPTSPANYFRRASLPGTAGAGFIYTFPRGLIVATSASLVVHNIVVAVAGDVYAVEQE